ncbi:hypothetical protein B0H11DRAFT_1392313 [Mycena galericulata]|nr:hypothetical protein B0H11DRAFT_1392313 [Mycena galericulata]
MSDSQLYSRLLLPKGHGYPLFHPQPYDDLWEIRKTGTEIGDVGVVKDGCFDVIFNICCAADHQINRRFDRGLPEGFEQLQLSPGDLAPHASYHPPGADISNTRITKRRLDIDASVENNVFLPVGAGAVVEISATAKETALLLLPDGASRCDLRPLQVFKDYALKHARNWYAFVNGRLGWMVEAGDLYLITGVDKSSTWSVLAMENRSEDLHLSLKLKAAQLASAGGSCRWEWENNSSFANSGPRREPGFTEEQPKKDQTVFLRGFKVAVRSSPWTRSAKALSIVDSKPSNILSKGGFIPFSQPRSGSAGNVFRGSGSSSGRGGASNEDESADFFPSHHQAYHPANAINEYLLNSSPGANVAVTHDNEWASVLSADEKLPGNIELIERISRRYRTHTTSGNLSSSLAFPVTHVCRRWGLASGLRRNSSYCTHGHSGS